MVALVCMWDLLITPHNTLGLFFLSCDECMFRNTAREKNPTETLWNVTQRNMYGHKLPD